MKRILVTGGAGFLGSNLCRRLIGDGHEVVCVDNLQTASGRNIEPLDGNPRFEFISHDIVEPLSVEVDQIYNLACPASPPRYQSDPIQTTKTAVLGSLNMLELAKRLGCRILQGSTSEVYGDPEVHPQPESYTGNVNPHGPRACYDEGKRCAESLFFDYHRHHGIDIRVVRIFNTYGPGMDPADGRVTSNFIVQALRGESLTIYGDGSQTRSPCYVDDLIEGMVRMMEAEPGAPGPVNLGNPAECTIAKLAEIVAAKVGNTMPPTHHDFPQDDPRRRRPDISLAKSLLGWEPKVDLDEGLDRTIPYFRDLIAGD